MKSRNSGILEVVKYIQSHMTPKDIFGDDCAEN